jgi:hypothetical protein
MHIYQDEYNDGLAEKILAKTSLAYTVEAQLCTKNDINFSKANNTEYQKTVSNFKDEDLYYVQSILVSSSWNKNDDIFDKKEVWAARATPEDKPTNVEHDEDQIVGHIIANWPIDSEGKPIPEDIDVDNLPDKFHIVTGSVIYRNFVSPELKERSEKLIQQIQAGTKYVSMECFFDSFDYGLTNKSSGEYKVLKRDDNTSYLTKHLRAYGGVGEYDNYKIGRVLRNINFSGKGFVDKPANPDSIIFENDMTRKILSSKNVHFDNNSVSNLTESLNQENDKMSLETDVQSLKEKVEAMTDCGALVKEAYTRVNELEAMMRDSEVAMKKMHEDMENKDKEMAAKDKLMEEYKNKMQYDVAAAEELKASEVQNLIASNEEAVKAKDSEIETLKNELTVANEIIDGYKAKEVEMIRQNKIMSRVTELVQAGVENSVAEATVNRFEALDDESFATIKSLVLSHMPEWVKPAASVDADAETSAEATEEKTESTITEDVLETAEVEPGVDLSVGSEDDSEVQSTRASLMDFVYSRLGKPQFNKGE